MRKMFALESEMVEEPVTSPVDVLESAVTVAEIHEEVIEQTEAIHELQEMVQEGFEGTEPLVEVAEVMAEKVKDGEGLDEDSARMAEITVESIRVRLGMPKSKMGTPSLESFKSPRSRVEATRIALESIGDKIKMVWEKIISIIKEVGEKIKMFFVNIMKNYNGLVSHLEKLKASAGAVKSDAKMAKADLENVKLAKFFSIDKKADLSTVEKTLKTVGLFTTVSEKVLEFVAGKVPSIKFGEAGKIEEALSGFVTELGDLMGKTGLETKTDGDAISIGPLPGGDFMVFTADAKTMKLSLNFAPGKEAATTIKALSTSEVTKLLDEAISEAKKGEGLRKVAKASEESTKAMLKASEAVMKAISGIAEGETAKGYREAATIVSGVNSLVSKVSGKLPSLHYTTLKYVSDYAQASLTNLKAPKEEKKEKA